MTRLHKILIGLLVAQTAFAIVMLTRDDAVRIAPMQPIITGLDVAAVTRVQVFDKGADKATLDITRAGDAWQLASHFAHPVDGTKLDDLLRKLGAMKSRGPIATSSVRHEQLGVADKKFERKLVVSTAKGDTVIFVGGGAAGGGRQTPVRIGSDPRVWGVTGINAWQVETAPGRWIEPTYLSLDKEQVSRVVVQGKTGSVELERTPTGWQLAIAGQPVVPGPGETLDAATIDRIVGQLAKLDITQPGDPKRDASAPTATVSIWMTAPDPAAAATSAAERQADHVVDLIADGTNFWVHERNKPTAGIATETVVGELVKASRETLVKKPSAETPPPTPGGSGAPPGIPPAPPGPKPSVAPKKPATPAPAKAPAAKPPAKPPAKAPATAPPTHP